MNCEFYKIVLDQGKIRYSDNITSLYVSNYKNKNKINLDFT